MNKEINDKPEKHQSKLSFAKKIKYVFSFSKNNLNEFPHLIRYRIITSILLCLIIFGIIFFNVNNSYFKASNIKVQITKKVEQQEISKDRIGTTDKSIQIPKKPNKTAIKEVNTSNEKLKLQHEDSKDRKFSDENKNADIYLPDITEQHIYEVSFTDVVRNSATGLTRGVETETEYLPEIFIEGDSYKGEMNNGKFEGKGVLMKTNGDKYEGDFFRGNYDGYGTYTWKDGSNYVGFWKESKFNGKGIFTLKNKTKFEGFWKNNELNGWGWLYKPNGEIYSGNWKNGKANGKGNYTWTNNTVYEGNFRNGEIEGYGVLKKNKSIISTGIWKNNKLVRKFSKNADLLYLKNFNIKSKHQIT